jgi:hypothetical protein
MNISPTAPATTSLPPTPAITLPAPVIILGRDDNGRPHASFFPATDTRAAEKAAELMGMAALKVEGDELRAFLGRLPQGKLFESGKAFVPFVKRSVYDQLAVHLEKSYLARVAARVETTHEAAAGGYAAASKGEVPPRLPNDWSKLLIGDLVLAADDPADGWFDAEVLALLSDDRLKLRWRDYAHLPTFSRGLTEIALLHPKFLAR